MNAALAAYYGVPVVAVSGDDVAIAEIAEAAPQAVGVVVKRAINVRAVELKPLQAARREIQQAAKTGVERAAKMPPVRGPVRVQFSRGLDPKSVAGSIRISYPGAGPDVAPPPFQTTYDAASRALTIRFAQPLERFRTVRVEILDTLKAFDGGAAKPWSLTFTVG